MYTPTYKNQRVPPWALGICALALIALGSVFISWSPSPSPAAAMTVLHIVGFKVANATELPDISRNMLALKDSCVRDGRPYILDVRGGRQSNKEGHDGGVQVVFLVEFGNQADADYYIDHDPAHTAFKTYLGTTSFTGATVLDFTPGEF
ncbi:hypothetical protein Q8F55_000371 [Vanrija albida]|uniref:Stress-response A/B barrel domain-containing protein n=1 Tax=Vanrija albida TaxID=181172 RepID=A0ABR3QD33_9TREE